MANPRLLVLALGFGFTTAPASAQYLASPLKSWTASLGVPQATRSVLQVRSGDYRVEGTVVGGLLLGALGYWVGHESCKTQPQPTGPNGNDCGTNGLVVGAVGGVVGAGLGYLLGRSINR